MGSVTGGCGATCGIQRVREREREAALAAILRAYPNFSWRPDPTEVTAPFDLDRIAALGRELEELLPVRAMARAGGSQGCDALYLLAGLHAPCLLEVAEGSVAMGRAAPGRGEASSSGSTRLEARETYLRLAFSPMGRYVALQEVVFTSERLDEAMLEITETPCVGVEDRRLQLVVKGLQGKLRSQHLVLLDMAFLVQAPPAPEPSGHAHQHGPDASRAPSDGPSIPLVDLFGGAPSLWSFLFEGAPAGTPRFTVVSAP